MNTYIIGKNFSLAWPRNIRFNVSFFAIFLFFIAGSAAPVDQVAMVNIGVVNFLYVQENGYKSQSNPDLEIENNMLIPAIKSELEQYQLSKYRIQFEKVRSGNLDYFGPSELSMNYQENELDPYDVLVWGLVTPHQWPGSYNLHLLLFTRSNPVFSANFEIRNGKIVSWNNKKCRLPEVAINIIPVVLAYKIAGSARQINRSDLNSQTNPVIRQRLREYGINIPVSEVESLLNWYPKHSKVAASQVGMLNIELEKDISYGLNLTQSTYDLIQNYLKTDRTFNWFLEQSGFLMPEIAIGTIGPDRDMEAARIDLPYTEQSMQEKFKIGIIPLVNDSKQSDNDWLGFGLEYLLSNKLSHILAYKLADKDVVLKFTQSDSASVKVNGVEWTLDYSIDGHYDTHGDRLDVRLDIVKAYGGIRIASERYQRNKQDLFEIVDDAVEKFIRITSVDLSQMEERIINRRVTSSLKAFEYFCMGYIESSKPRSNVDVIINYFKEALREDPEFWGAYYNLGTTYYNNKDYNRALNQFTYIIDNFPGFEMAYLGRGLTFLHDKKYQQAKKDFLVYADHKPNDFRAYYYAGRASFGEKKYTESIKYLGKAAEINPNDSKTLFELGNVYYVLNQYRKAVAHYRNVLKLESDHLETHKRLGESYYHLHNFKGAVDEFNKVIAVKPDDPETNFMLGITVYKEALLDEYIDSFLEMYGLESRNKKSKNMANNENEKLGIYKNMIDRFTQAQRGRDNFFEATFNLALTYQEMGKPDSAIHFYRKTLQINPQLVKARIVLGKLYENLDERSKALEQYKQVVRTDPAYFLRYPSLGPLHGGINIIDAVVKEVETEVQRDPHNINSNLILANIYYAQGFQGKAAVLYRKVLSLYPEQGTAKKMLARLNNGH
jgi:tetratricopeptide (TPR) repeat protein/TolB-like protein